MGYGLDGNIIKNQYQTNQEDANIGRDRKHKKTEDEEMEQA